MESKLREKFLDPRCVLIDNGKHWENCGTATRRIKEIELAEFATGTGENMDWGR